MIFHNSTLSTAPSRSSTGIWLEWRSSWQARKGNNKGLFIFADLPMHSGSAAGNYMARRRGRVAFFNYQFLSQGSVAKRISAYRDTTCHLLYHASGTGRTRSATSSCSPDWLPRPRATTVSIGVRDRGDARQQDTADTNTRTQRSGNRR